MNLAQLVREIIDAKVQRWSIPPKKLSLHMGPVKAQLSFLKLFPLDVSLSWFALQFFASRNFLKFAWLLILVSGILHDSFYWVWKLSVWFQLCFILLKKCLKYGKCICCSIYSKHFTKIILSATISNCFWYFIYPCLNHPFHV